MLPCPRPMLVLWPRRTWFGFCKIVVGAGQGGSVRMILPARASHPYTVRHRSPLVLNSRRGGRRTSRNAVNAWIRNYLRGDAGKPIAGYQAARSIIKSPGPKTPGLRGQLSALFQCEGVGERHSAIQTPRVGNGSIHSPPQSPQRPQSSWSPIYKILCNERDGMNALGWF
jgi:hypothetical protein